MGGTCELPVGPFQMAVTRNLPLVPIFIMKDRWDTYHVYVDVAYPDESLSKKERMQALAQHFADQMANIVDKYPTQWYNYFEFVSNLN